MFGHVWYINHTCIQVPSSTFVYYHVFPNRFHKVTFRPEASTTMGCIPPSCWTYWVQSGRFGQITCFVTALFHILSWLPHNPHASLCCVKVASCISRPDATPDASSWTNMINMNSRCELLGSICLLCDFMQCLLMCLPVPFQCWLSSQIGNIKNQEWPKNTKTKTKETEWQTAPLRRFGRNMVERQIAIYLTRVLGGFCMFQGWT